MKMEKALVRVNGDTVSFNINIQKSNIDVENRIVSGWATVDNVDQEGDQVTAAASADAFSTFRGNIREMHAAKAVGRLVDYKQQKFYTKEGNEYTGIFVSVYVSKGAEDTWQKVLDGTLNAFSINGPIDTSTVEKKYIEETGSMARIINKYKLLELSLVDAPGNELCDVVSVLKSIGTEEANDIEIENVFWCEQDRSAVVHKNSEHNCSVCDNAMKNIGWFEVLEQTETSEEVRKILEAYTANVTKGGPNMANEVENTEEVAEVVEAPEAEVAEAEETEVEKVEGADAEVEDVVEPDLAQLEKALSEVKTVLQNVSEDSKSRESALEDVRKAVSAVETNVEAKLGELLDRHNELTKEVTVLKETFGGVEKRLSGVESATAVQKSNTVVEEEENVTKSNSGKKGFWTGSFVPSE